MIPNEHKNANSNKDWETKKKKRNSTFSRLWFTNSVLFKSFSSERDDDGAAGGVKYKKKTTKVAHAQQQQRNVKRFHMEAVPH